MLAAAVPVIAGFALTGVAETGQIFQQWDAVVSWNRWAVEWAANELPAATSYYPQLLPANISLSYVFMQTSQVWIFAKAVQFLFCFLLLLAMLDAARQPGNFGLVPGVAITYGLFVALLRYRKLSSGYADVPLAFFAWMPIYALLMASRALDDAQRSKWLLVGGLLAAGAALTKQMGLYVAAVYPLLARGCVSPSLLLPVSPSARPALRLYLSIGLLVAPWYIYKYADIQSGNDANNTPQLVLDCHEGRDLPLRLAHAAAELVEATTIPGGALLLAAVAASLGDRRSRWLLGLFVVPLGLLWAAAFSYDLRNLAMLVPFVGMAAGTGLVRTVCWAVRGIGRRGETERAKMQSHYLRPPSPRLPVFEPIREPQCRLSLRESSATFAKRKATLPARSRFSDRLVLSGRNRTTRVAHVAVLAILLSATAAFGIPDTTLLASQERQQRRVGILSLNRQLYAYAEAHPTGALIATDYAALRWLPDLAPRGVTCASHDLPAFHQTFDRADVRYVLLRTEDAAAEVRVFLALPQVARLLFDDHGFAFYEKLANSSGTR